MLRSRKLSRGWPGALVRSSADVATNLVSVGVGECPAEAGQLARDGNRDDRAALAGRSR
jgi:hypothetical protein